MEFNPESVHGLEHLTKLVVGRQYFANGSVWHIVWYYSDREPMDEVLDNPAKAKFIGNMLRSNKWNSKHDEQADIVIWTPPLDAAPPAGTDTDVTSGSVPDV